MTIAPTGCATIWVSVWPLTRRLVATTSATTAAPAIRRIFFIRRSYGRARGRATEEPGLRGFAKASDGLGGRPALLQPLPDQPAEVRGEALLLVRRVGRAHGLDQQPVEVGRGHPVEQ